MPSKSTVDESGEQTTEVLDQIFFGGDQLTEERARNAKHARGDGDSSFDRLEVSQAKWKTGMQFV